MEIGIGGIVEEDDGVVNGTVDGGVTGALVVGEIGGRHIKEVDSMGEYEEWVEEL